MYFREKIVSNFENTFQDFLQHEPAPTYDLERRSCALVLRLKRRQNSYDVHDEWDFVDASMISENFDDSGESPPADGLGEDTVRLIIDCNDPPTPLTPGSSTNSEMERRADPHLNGRFCFCPFDVNSAGVPHVCKGECDKECEVFMADLVDTIFSSSNKIDQETSAKFDNYCKYSAGRRHFAELLNQRRIRDKLVEEETFYRLVQFFAICLFECHEAEDFTPATTLMNMCFTFYYNDPNVLSNNKPEEDNGLSFLYTHLRDQHIWKSMRFWDVAFLTAMHQERTRWKSQHSNMEESPGYIQEIDEMEEKTTFGQLGTILHNMRELNIPKKECFKFLEKTSAIGNLTDDHYGILKEILGPIEERTETRERSSSNVSKVGKMFKNALSVRKKNGKK